MPTKVASYKPSGGTILGEPGFTAEQIDSILKSAGSPAVGSGVEFVSQSLTTGIDDVVAMAFFQHESSYGTAGVARVTHSIGNIRCTDGCALGYQTYPTWEDGVNAWYSLIHDYYIGVRGLRTIAAIIPVYAPPNDSNDDAAYIQSVENYIVNKGKV